MYTVIVEYGHADIHGHTQWILVPKYNCIGGDRLTVSYDTHSIPLCANNSIVMGRRIFEC